MSRLLPALTAFLISLAVLLPGALGPWRPFVDEAFTLWSAWYHGNRLAHLDFSPGSDAFTDHGWSPESWWNVTAPFGYRLLYLPAVALTGHPPAAPCNHWHPCPDPSVPPDTVKFARLTAVLLSSIGLALTALRLGWLGLIPAVLMLCAFPTNQTDLALAWAEPPLLAALGLCVVAFGTPYLAVAVALAATCKLTALPLLALCLWPRAVGLPRYSHLTALPLCLALWTLLNPTAWFAAGPLYLVQLLTYRSAEQVVLGQAFQMHNIGGVFVASRHFVPLQLALGVVLALLLPRSIPWRWVASRLPRSVGRLAP